MVVAGLCTGCSGDKEQEPSGAVRQMTDNMADKAVQEIRQPLEKAQHARDVANAHLNAVDEGLRQSSQ